MRQSKFVFNLDNGNNYMQDIGNNLLLYLPPLLNKYFRDEKDVIDGEDDYYRKKYWYLKKALTEDCDIPSI